MEKNYKNIPDVGSVEYLQYVHNHPDKLPPMISNGKERGLARKVSQTMLDPIELK